MNIDDLKSILAKHLQWLRSEPEGVRANLTGANLTRANLDGANLTRANLTRANLDGANLTRANLTGANLTRANLTRTNLTRANLTRANLDGANLDGANLTRANLTRANLTGANLDGANLTRANLTRANLTRANLDGAKNAPLSASVSWTAHGECGRTLTVLRHADAVTYRCGCFHGTESELRDHIANGEENYRASRTVALDFVAARMAEMIAEIK